MGLFGTPNLLPGRAVPRLTETKSPYTGHFLTISSAYRRQLHKHPFALFGLPFILTIVFGSFFLTPATAVRYERFDRKTHMLDRDEVLSLEDKKRKEKLKGGFKQRDIREEYFKLAGHGEKLDDWEPVRVKRLEGEPDGTM